MGVKKVIKREGNLQDFDEKRIENAIKKAMLATNTYDEKKLKKCVNYVVRVLNERYGEEKYPHVEEIQDIVEFSLMKFGLFETAKAFVLYRKERKRIREEKKKILEKDSLDEVDKVFSVNALRVLASRYLLKNPEGKLIESPKQMFQRVAMLVVIPDILYDTRIYDKEGRQPVHDAEEFDAEAHEHKVGLGRKEEGFAVTWNRWHLKRMKALYDDLNREGKMKLPWSEFFEKLSKGEFDSYYENFLTYYNLMVGKKFLPNSPTLFNAGAQLSQLSACFVLPIEDNMESIMKAARDAAFIFKTGGGVGINYSALRPEGDIVASTSGVASGPISFMKIIDTITDVIKQGGKRRGANMGILEIWHPDIEKFITLKSVEGTFENFNISVMLNDEFFEKLERREKFSLINPRTGKVVKRIDPRYLLELIAQNAWKSGDPGVLFLDNINRHNVMKEYLGEIRSTNPCVTGDTLVLTDHGLIRARNLKEGMRVWTLEGWREIERVIDNGVKPIYEIETVNGIKLHATPEHKILTNNGWKEVRELTENDKIRVVTEVPDEYPNCKFDKYTEDFIEFLGAWVGDSNVVGHGVGEVGKLSVSDHVSLHVGDDYSLVSHFHPVADNLSGHAFVVERERQYVIDSHTTVVVQWGKGWRVKQFADIIREIFEIDRSRSSEKRIPELVFTLPKKLQASFLRGLFSADGSVYDANGSVTISLSSTSKKLLEETQILLLSFGIFSTLTREKRNETKSIKGKEYKVKGTWRLLINGYDAYVFYRAIGLLGSKKKKMENLFKNKKFYNKKESKTWVKIKRVRPLGKERVYDITAPPTFTWITNGIYSYDCGEQPLYPYDSCNLGSINLYAFVKEKENGEKVFDWEEYDRTIKLCYRFLDNIIDVNDFPLREIKERNRNLRNVGLGMMGLADVLYALRIPYHSEEGFELMRKFAEHLTYYAMRESVERAKERGAFKLFDKSGYVKGEMPVEGFYRKEEWTLPWNELAEEIRKFGIRNVNVTTIAPTGSISMILDTSAGIEPQFALVFEKIVTVGSFYYVDEEFKEQLQKAGLYKDSLLKKISENAGSVQGIDEIPEEMKRVFVVAYDIPWWDHVRAQHEIQKWITNSISKTINMPSWVSIDDVKNAYFLAYKLGLKGITIYRDGSKTKQVLVTPTQKTGRYLKIIENKTLEMARRYGIEIETNNNNNHTARAESCVEKKTEAVLVLTPEKKNVCPACGSDKLVYKEGCVTCENCGWGKCV